MRVGISARVGSLLWFVLTPFAPARLTKLNKTAPKLKYVCVVCVLVVLWQEFKLICVSDGWMDEWMDGVILFSF